MNNRYMLFVPCILLVVVRLAVVIMCTAIVISASL